MDPTAEGDEIASRLRTYYEANRETFWQRCHFNPRGRAWETSADEFMLGLINELHRIERDEFMLGLLDELHRIERDERGAP